MDGLTDEERALAWIASWNPSFEGIAIVNSDFTFRSVNQQWCEICGVTPAEFVGNTFSDITPQPIRDLDVKNAELVKQGTITSYLLPKTYEFSNGRKVNIVLLVAGVYHKQTRKFLFYVSRIMTNNLDIDTESPPLSPTPSGLFYRIKQHWQMIAVFLGAFAYIMAETIKYMRNE